MGVEILFVFVVLSTALIYCCIGVPLLNASIATPSEETRILFFYVLVAIILVGLLHPMRLSHNRPSPQVTIMDALGKYHDLPWAACEDLTVR